MHSFRMVRGVSSEERSPPRHRADIAAQDKTVTQQGRFLGSFQPPLAPTEGGIRFKVAVVTIFKALPGIHFSYQETVCHSMATTSHKSFILLLD